MQDITLGNLASWGAFAVTFIGVITFFVNPLKKFMKRVEAIETNREKDNERLETISKDQKMILSCINAMLLHMESGNNTGDLKAQKKKLDDYMINR